MKLLIINGPNLNLLGKREPEIYGKQGFDAVLSGLRSRYPEHHIDYYQSNIEGELIDKVQQAEGVYDGIILNAGGYTHTSVALGDAIRAVATTVVEVHISNVFSREAYRHTSYIAPHCTGVITGFGTNSYALAIEGLMARSV
jgi:3-dehydroquinate dehydratase II